MKRILFLVLIVPLSIGLASFSYSQGRQTGAISGIVFDVEGNKLPGTIVTIYGKASLGQSYYVTSSSGKFRFPSLMPGTGYELRAEMPGFKTVIRPNLVVNVGKTTDVTINLEVTTIEEEITPTDRSPVVDVESTKLSVHYNTEVTTHIPMNRDLYDIQNSIPGAVSEEAANRRTSSILGGTVRSSLYALDGVPMNDPTTFQAMANLNVDAYEEIEFGLGALPAAVGQTNSVYINIVTKSGGNEPYGGITAYYTGDRLTEDLVSESEIMALNQNPPEKFTDYRDFSLTLGGFFFKDQAWFFLNGRRLTWEKLNPYAQEDRMANLGITSPHYDLKHGEWLGFSKFTVQITDSIRYMGMFHYNHVYEPYYTNRVNPNESYQTTTILNNENIYTTSHQINWVLNQDTFLDIRGTYVHRKLPLNNQPGLEDNYTYYDNKEDVYWGRTYYDIENVRKKLLASASITRFLDSFLGVSHEFTAGADFEQNDSHRDWFRLNPYYSYWNDYAAGNPYYLSPSEKIGLLKIHNCPPLRRIWDVQDNTRRISSFIQDIIMAGNLTLNLGLRFDYSFQYEPFQFRPNLTYDYGPENLSPGIGQDIFLEALIDQYHQEIGAISPFDELLLPNKRIVTFSTFSPRLGIAFDIFGNGRSVLKLSFARYYEPIWINKYDRGQILAPGSIEWKWYDQNENKLMDLPGTDKYILIRETEQDTIFNYYADNLKPPYVNEFLGGIELELLEDMKLGIQFVWKQNKNIVEDFDLNNGYDFNATDEIGSIWVPYSFVDPGYDGEFNTDDDQDLAVYGLRTDRPIPKLKGINPSEAQRKYQAVILTLDKRMSNRWQLKGSCVLSSFKGNTSAGYSPTEGETAMFNHPNSLTLAYGPLFFDRPLQVKIMGSFVFPYGFILSAYFQHYSGSPWARTLDRVYFPPDFDVQQEYFSIFAEPRGSRRSAPSTNLDIRVEKGFSVKNYGRLNLFVDIFNVGSRNGIIYHENPNGSLKYYEIPPEYSPSPLYKTASHVYGVRSFRIGIRWNF